MSEALEIAWQERKDAYRRVAHHDEGADVFFAEARDARQDGDMEKWGVLFREALEMQGKALSICYVADRKFTWAIAKDCGPDVTGHWEGGTFILSTGQRFN